jgi:hypothetical protein
MHERCPVCDLTFAREPGYFTGAMYVSYAMSVPVLAALYFTLALLRPQGSFESVLATASALFLVFVPFIFRYSRILWIHLDRAIDAGE